MEWAPRLVGKNLEFREGSELGRSGKDISRWQEIPCVLAPQNLRSVKL